VERNESWSNLRYRYYIGFYVEGLSRITRNVSQGSLQPGSVQNEEQKSYSLERDIYISLPQTTVCRKCIWKVWGLPIWALLPFKHFENGRLSAWFHGYTEFQDHVLYNTLTLYATHVLLLHCTRHNLAKSPHKTLAARASEEASSSTGLLGTECGFLLKYYNSNDPQ
jgi:hypothetical protein